ncbi:MAG: YkgJ family cysteine cluster protein [Bacteroidota bacterium]
MGYIKVPGWCQNHINQAVPANRNLAFARHSILRMALWFMIPRNPSDLMDLEKGKKFGTFEQLVTVENYIVMLPIELDLSKIERLSIQRESENFAFRMFLKGLDSIVVDRKVHRLHREVTARINCLDCGNCCNSLMPRVEEEEIQFLAELDKVSIEDYTRDHLDEDKYEASLFIKSSPCRYLDGKRCTIYDHRPKECREYPYTHRRRFVFRTLSMISNYSICPIVFNIIENLKAELNFRHG